MRQYITRDQKEAILCLAGCVGFCQTLIQSDLPRYKSVREHLKKTVDAANTALEEMEKDMDADQLRGVLNFANNSVLEILPKYSEIGNKDLYVVESWAMERLLQDVLTDCTFCEKTAKEAKKCQRRKDLLACGMAGTGSNCPFMV